MLALPTPTIRGNPVNRLTAIILALVFVACASDAVAPTVSPTRTATPKAGVPAPTANADY